LRCGDPVRNFLELIGIEHRNDFSR
jgi:hypothetical protein